MLARCLEAALEYEARGWSVVPIQPGEKYPSVPWVEFQKRRATPDEIRSWWKMWPGANVGIVTGEISGVVVADVDPRHGGDASKQWREAPTELISDTGGGGHHLFYEHPGGFVSSTVNKWEGIDVRADQAIVVLPPSVHPSGRPYAWRQQGPPGKWVERQAGPAPEEGERPKWLTDALAGVSSGKRDDTGAKIAGYFQSKGVPQDVAEQILLNWASKNNPPLPPSDIKRIVDSVYRGAARRAVQTGVAINSGPTRAASPFAITPFRSFMQKYGEREVRWIVKDWLPEDTMLLTVAPPGTYKTWLLFDIAISIATGTPFLGVFPVEKQGPVIIVQQEDPHGDIATRLSEIFWHRMGLDPGEQDGEEFTLKMPPTIPLHIHEDRQLHFEDQNSMQSLYAMVETVRPVLVIIDPLYSAASTDDFMAKATSSMLMLKTMRDKFRSSFAIAHHTKKRTDGKSVDREDAWGSQFLNAFLETGWQVRRVEGKSNTVTVQPHFKVKGEVPPVVLRFDVATEEEHRYKVDILDEEEQKQTGGPSRILQLIEESPHSTQDLVAKTGMSLADVRETLNRLKLDGVAVQQGKLWTVGPDMPPI